MQPVSPTDADRLAGLPFSPAAERNAPPILAVLRLHWPAAAEVLEIASGTGQHAAHFAAAQPRWHWQPTEASADQLPAIAARCSGLPGVRPPVLLDVLAGPWPEAAADAVFVANLLHIAPASVTPACMQGAARALRPGGRLAVYGPFVVDGEPLAASNAAFDADLRARNPSWGLRKLAEVVRQARLAGLVLRERVPMPANNLLLLFQQSEDPPCP